MNTEKPTKHTICEAIENELKERKIRYTVSNQDSRGCLYEIFISSVEGYVQVEYNLDDDSDNYFLLQSFTNVDANGNSLYHSDWDSESGENVEGEIEELVNNIKRINQGISKIQNKIEQIKDICEEYNLEVDDFIDVIYDFD